MTSEIKYTIEPSSEAAKKIYDFFKEELFPNNPPEVLEEVIMVDLNELFSQKLVDNLYCFIEYPYVDRIFRDSYYSYYSSKHYPYKRDCIRVSLFEGAITILDFVNSKNHPSLQEKYLGYFIIRPLPNAIFGRSIINPKAFKSNDINICFTQSNVSVFGAKLSTIGFPHSAQDVETISCAETTIWALMEYFSTKYPDYHPTLPSKIHKTLESISFERQLPSNGLTMDQISFALKKYGFGPRIYSSKFVDLESLTQVYLESGIPVVLGLENSEGDGHAILAIGKRHNSIDFDSFVKRSLKIDDTEEVQYFDSSDFKDSLVVQDDNLFPYEVISFDMPGEHYDEKSPGKSYHIDSMIVPLYPKIYLEAYMAKELIKQIITDSEIGTELEDDFILRFYLTSSRSFKNHITRQEKMTDDSKFDIISIKMPKFIWCAEIYKKENYLGNKEASNLILLDATEADYENFDALIFAGYEDRCLCMSNGELNEMHYEFKNYSYFSNLK